MMKLMMLMLVSLRLRYIHSRDPGRNSEEAN